MDVKFLPAGDTAIVVEFGDAIDRDLSDRVLRLGARIREAGLPGVVEAVPTFRSLMVHYDPLAASSAELIQAFEALLGDEAGESRTAMLWRIPACYEDSHAPDLSEVCERTGMGRDDVVGLHSGTTFHVYMIGFVPGYPYMGDLPPSLVLPRRHDPRIRVPAGSIAIASTMTAIYPLESPGGWHLIGTTPVRLFDAGWPRPALLSPGDSVRFQPVSVREFEAIRKESEAGTYRVPGEEVKA